MQIYPDPQFVADTVASKLSEQASSNRAKWTVVEPIEIREMPWSTLYFITFDRDGIQDKVVAKITHYPDQTTPERSWTDPDLVLRGEREYESMVRVHEHFQQDPEAGLATVEGLAFIPEYNIVVMPFVVFESIYDTCMTTTKLISGKEIDQSLDYVRRAGRWLRKMHGLPIDIDNVSPERRLGPQDSVKSILDDVLVLQELGVDPSRFPQWNDTITILQNIQTDKRVWTHDDYHMRNVFVLPNGDVMSLDTALNFADSPYADIGKILADMKTRRARVMRFGLLPSDRTVDRFQQAFLDGYFDGDAPDPMLLALYEGQFIMEKWAESLSVIQEKLPPPLSTIASKVPVNYVFSRMIHRWMDAVAAAQAAVESPQNLPNPDPKRGEQSMINKLFSDKRVMLLVAFGAVYSILTFLMPFVLSEKTVGRQIREDSLIEYLGALGFFVAGVAFLAAFFLERTGNRLGPIRTPRNLVYLGLAAILLFGAGEEISWGQRILGYGTPDTFEENEQEEVSIHNLPLFDTSNAGNLLQFNRLFILFWFTIGIFIPLAAISSKSIRLKLRELGIPVVSLTIGGLFLINYVLSKMYGFVFDGDKLEDPQRWDGRLSEIRESQEGVIFALVGIYILLLVLERREESSPTTTSAPERFSDAQPESAA
jgi:hypothetical protein